MLKFRTMFWTSRILLKTMRMALVQPRARDSLTIPWITRLLVTRKRRISHQINAAQIQSAMAAMRVSADSKKVILRKLRTPCLLWRRQLSWRKTKSTTKLSRITEICEGTTQVWSIFSMKLLPSETPSCRPSSIQHARTKIWSFYNSSLRERVLNIWTFSHRS